LHIQLVEAECVCRSQKRSGLGVKNPVAQIKAVVIAGSIRWYWGRQLKRWQRDRLAGCAEIPRPAPDILYNVRGGYEKDQLVNPDEDTRSDRIRTMNAFFVDRAQDS
jgi:hypothetical protein